jgi:uncharacterized repeat protein (TIGR03803 family)
MPTQCLRPWHRKVSGMRSARCRFGHSVLSLLALVVANSLVVSKALAATDNVLWNFGSGTDGTNSQANLISDSNGNLYGTTSVGGLYGNGIVFELIKPSAGGNWSESVLWNFGYNSINNFDGSGPAAGLVIDTSGNLYGTTTYGGAYGALSWDGASYSSSRIQRTMAEGVGPNRSCGALVMGLTAPDPLVD